MTLHHRRQQVTIRRRQGTALDEQLAERPLAVLHPGVHRLDELLAADEVHSQGQDAEEQIAIRGHQRSPPPTPSASPGLVDRINRRRRTHSSAASPARTVDTQLPPPLPRWQESTPPQDSEGGRLRSSVIRCQSLRQHAAANNRNFRSLALPLPFQNLSIGTG